METVVGYETKDLPHKMRCRICNKLVKTSTYDLNELNKIGCGIPVVLPDGTRGDRIAYILCMKCHDKVRYDENGKWRKGDDPRQWEKWVQQVIENGT